MNNFGPIEARKSPLRDAHTRTCPRCGRDLKVSGNKKPEDGIILCRDCRDMVKGKDNANDRVWYDLYTGARTFDEIKEAG